MIDSQDSGGDSGRPQPAVGATSRTSMLERITDSRDFSVGGGSAAALSGSMGAALAAMVARLSESGEFGLSTGECRTIAARADSLSRELMLGAEDDAEAYRLLKDAHRLRRTGRSPERACAEAIELAAVNASTVPRDNARRCRAVVEQCCDLLGKSNPSAASDLDVACLLSEAALVGCVRNVEVNVPLIHDAATAADFSREAAKLRDFAGRHIRVSVSMEEA
jgi:formiminotetrahydrofolate cyclodeaminase